VYASACDVFLHGFIDLYQLTAACGVSSVLIQVNLKKANGPFIIYDCPDFEAKKHIQMRAFYIVLGIDERFLRMDENANWYSARVVPPYQVHFRIPSWPFALYPHPKNTKADVFWKTFSSTVPVSVKQEMINVHSLFDADNQESVSTSVVEDRKWSNIVLDFSKVKGVGELSSQVLYADAGPNEKVDFDYIELPVFGVDTNEDKEVGTEAFLGFKVGVHPPDGEGARKVGRSSAPKSTLAKKKAAAAEARKNAKGGIPAGGEDETGMDEDED
jgi:hypothetical protein